MEPSFFALVGTMFGDADDFQNGVTGDRFPNLERLGWSAHIRPPTAGAARRQRRRGCRAAGPMA